MKSMEEMAWVIRTKKINRPSGFLQGHVPEEGVEVKPTEVVIDAPRGKPSWDRDEWDDPAPSKE